VGYLGSNGDNGGTNYSGNGSNQYGATGYGGGAGGGGTYGSSDLTHIYLGSGGGSSGCYPGYTCAAGGEGGGIIFVSAQTSYISGTIVSAGNNGAVAGSASGGGGSGGSVYLIISTLNITNTSLNVSGGLRGGSGYVGGDGGKGRVRLDYTTINSTFDASEFGSYYAGNITSALTTNATGDYIFNISAPSVRGIYPVLVKVNYSGYYTENSQNITVYQIPIINSYSPVPLRVYYAGTYGTTFYITVNVTDDNLVSMLLLMVLQWSTTQMQVHIMVISGTHQATQLTDMGSGTTQ
jgi:hypothetical protein